MPIEIGSVQLSKIHHIQTLEDASFVYQAIPGVAGDVVQDLGRAAVRLGVEGIFYGNERQTQLAALRQLYLAREPVDFIVDMLDQAYASQVTLESLNVEEIAQQPDQYNFRVVLREYIRPPRSNNSGGASLLGSASAGLFDSANIDVLDNINDKIKVDAATLLEISSLPEALKFGAIPELTNPFEPLNQALDPIKDAGTGLLDAMQSLKNLLG